MDGVKGGRVQVRGHVGDVLDRVNVQAGLDTGKRLALAHPHDLVLWPDRGEEVKSLLVQIVNQMEAGILSTRVVDEVRFLAKSEVLKEGKVSCVSHGRGRMGKGGRGEAGTRANGKLTTSVL